MRSAAEIAATRQELGLVPDDFAVGTVTRLHDSKGNDVPDRRRRATCSPRGRRRVSCWWARGLSRRRSRRRRTRMGLGDRFRFHGFHRDTAAVLSAFDLSVFPSLWEGTPLTAFEALAAGKPIVSTDADGLHGHSRGRRDRVGRARSAKPARWPGRSSTPSTIRRSGPPRPRPPESPAAAYDIAAFVRKMERLYALLHETSRTTHRQGRHPRRPVVPRRRPAAASRRREAANPAALGHDPTPEAVDRPARVE